MVSGPGPYGADAPVDRLIPAFLGAGVAVLQFPGAAGDNHS
jgi:hypothetical protein